MYSNLQDGKIMTPTEIIKLIKAYEEGKAVEMQYGSIWIECNPPVWNFEFNNYRVKQKEKVLYQYLYFDSRQPSMYRASIGFYETIEEAQSKFIPPVQVICKLEHTKTIIKE